jgi:hypothetical protein
MCRFAVVASFLYWFAFGSTPLAAGELPVIEPAAAHHQTTPDRARPSPWSVTVFGGQSAKTNFTKMVFSPWNTSFENTTFLGGNLARRLLDLGWNFSIDAEVGAGQRFGNSDATEVWGAFYLRFDGFPWNHIVYTTWAASTGLNYASNISAREITKSGNGKGSKFLHYFSPEMTFANPDYKDLALVFRLHHRSGMFGLFNGVNGGSTMVTLGLRYHF